MNRPMPQPLRQAWALSYAMRTRPTPELATVYFNALRRVIEECGCEAQPGAVPGLCAVSGRDARGVRAGCSDGVGNGKRS